MITLLAVDDEAAINLIIRTYFDHKYRVVTMSGVSAALSYLKNGGEADIIVADLNMPDIDGLAFIAELKSDETLAAIPLIILSGEESSARRIECLRKGADDYLAKPFNPEELEVRMDKALSIRKVV